MIASKAHPWVIRLSILMAALGIVGTAAALIGTNEFGDGSAALVTLSTCCPPAIVSG